jgi:hypothetical protein
MGHDDIGKDLAGLNAIEADVGIHGGFYAAVTEKLPHKLVLARPLFKNDSAGGMPELVDGHLKSSGLVDASDDLPTERYFLLRAFPLPGKQIVLIAVS